MIKKIALTVLLCLPIPAFSGTWINIEGLEGKFYKNTKVIDGDFYKLVFYFDGDNKLKKIYDCTSRSNTTFQQVCDLRTQSS